jgi:thiol-disulfide isomerase/thioredoxin
MLARQPAVSSRRHRASGILPRPDRIEDPILPPSPRPRRPALALLALALLVAACSSGTGASPAPSSPASIAPSTAPSGDPSPTPSGAAPSGPVASASAAPSEAAGPTLTQPWATATLTDVATGETFRIADLATGGRTVFVEMMAIWCTNCRRQQGEFTDALARLDPARVAYVVLDVEPSETADQLAGYKDQQGFEGRYAIAGADVSRALVDEFGPNAINPPTVPKLVIGPDGSVSFETGAGSSDDIVARVGG